MVTLEELAERLTNRITGWEYAFLRRLGERIKKIGGMTPADAAALNNAADVKRDFRKLLKALAKELGITIRGAEKLYMAALAEAQKIDDPLFDYRGKAFLPVAKDPRWRSMVRAYAKNTAKTMLNIVNTDMLCTVGADGRVVSLAQAYYDVLDKATVAVTSGTTDFQTAMRDSILALGGNGVRVHYGSGVTRRLDTVVRQNLMWGAKQAREQYQEEIGEELSCDGIEIDWHRNPRPSHEFMQGKQFHLGGSVTINGTVYPDAAPAQAALEDYNCYHYSTPIICGVSVPRYTDAELKKLNAENAQKHTIGDKTLTGYEWSQNMRKLETAIRKQKTIKEMALAAGDKQLAKDCDAKIKAFMEKYEEISKATGIPEDTKRLSIVRPVAT